MHRADNYTCQANNGIHCTLGEYACSDYQY